MGKNYLGFGDKGKVLGWKLGERVFVIILSLIFESSVFVDRVVYISFCRVKIGLFFFFLYTSTRLR